MQENTGAQRLPETIPQPPAPVAPRRIRTQWSRIEARIQTALLILALIYTLSIAQQFLIPVALAFLLSLMLSPLVRWLQKLHVPRALGAAAVVVLLLSAISYGVSSSLDPIDNWFDNAPRVLRQLERKVYPIKRTVEEVSKTADQVDRMTSVGPAQTIEVKDISFRNMLYSNALDLVTGTVIATLLLYFFLSWGQVMLKRLSPMLSGQGSRTAFLELASVLEVEVSKYLSMITLINFGLGVVVALTLYVMEMPNPLLWGSVAALFNFIPYLGGLATAVLLGATALLTFDGLPEAALVVAAFVGLTILEGQIVTPLILGRRLALNPLIVFLSVLFWFWLWGIAGALMAVPILITLKLVGDRVKSLRPVAVIAGR